MNVPETARVERTLTGSEAARVVAARDILASRPFTVAGVSCDSREIEPGWAFVAVKGAKLDGNDFLGEAEARGASSIVTDSPRPGRRLPQLVVDDAELALARLSLELHRGELRGLRLIGVTGTNGKTTVAFMLREIMRAAGLRPCLLGTVVHDLGGEVVPSSLTTPPAHHLHSLLARARRRGCSAAVMEVSSHALARGRVQGLEFACAVFTNLTHDHLDFHGDMRSYFDAKARLFEPLDERATAVLNRDDPRSRELASRTRARVVGYSARSDADFPASEVELSDSGTSFFLRARGRGLDVRMRALGAHNVENALAALAAAESTGVPLERAVEALASFRGAPGRLEPVEAGQGFAVLVDYAHTEDALRRGLSSLRAFARARVITVFGCGGDRDRTKRPGMARAAEELSDSVILTSDNPRTEDALSIIEDALAGFRRRREVRVEPDRREAIREAVGLADEGDVVLIAGKGHEDYQIVGTERLPFDDRAVAYEALMELRRS